LSVFLTQKTFARLSGNMGWIRDPGSGKSIPDLDLGFKKAPHHSFGSATQTCVEKSGRNIFKRGLGVKSNDQ
jgi:hypothetical protein